MLMRFPTEEDLKMSLPQTPPAYMAPVPSSPSYILPPPPSLTPPPLLSVVLPFKSYHRFAEGSRFSCVSLCSPGSISPSLSLSLPICFFLFFSFPIPFSLPPPFFLFPSPSLPPDIWANNQCHFIPLREQMEFQLRAWQRATNQTSPWRRPSWTGFTSSGGCLTTINWDPSPLKKSFLWRFSLYYTDCITWRSSGNGARQAARELKLQVFHSQSFKEFMSVTSKRRSKNHSWPPSAISMAIGNLHPLMRITRCIKKLQNQLLNGPPGETVADAASQGQTWTS